MPVWHHKAFGYGLIGDPRSRVLQRLEVDNKTISKTHSETPYNLLGTPKPFAPLLSTWPSSTKNLKKNIFSKFEKLSTIQGLFMKMVFIGFYWMGVRWPKRGQVIWWFPKGCRGPQNEFSTLSDWLLPISVILHSVDHLLDHSQAFFMKMIILTYTSMPLFAG